MEKSMKKTGCILCILLITISGLYARWTITTNIDPITDDYSYEFILDDNTSYNDNFIAGYDP